MASVHFADYIVFLFTVLSSFMIGVYYSCRKTNDSPEAYLVANRKLRIIPIAISLLVSFFSAISMMGNSSEVYYYGAEFWFVIIGWNIGGFLTTVTFIPLYLPLKLVSVHEYIFKRYKKKGLVYLGTVLQTMAICFVNGIVLFGPAIMLKSMMGIPVWMCMVATGLVSTIYTTIGGFQAVVWADFFQAIVICVGLLVITIMGTVKAGGLTEVWITYYEQDRLNLRFQPSLFMRSNVWAFLIGPLFAKLTLYGTSQLAVQRYCSLPSVQAARRAIYFSMPMHIIMVTMTCASGVVAFAYYTKLGCDPFRSGQISNTNQIIPFFIIDVMNYPCIPGLFVACIFCGSLSSLSSSYNSVSAMVWQDVVNDKIAGRNLTERQEALITKIISFVTGMVSICGGFLASNLGGTLIQITLSFAATIKLPISIMIVVGALSPRSSWKSSLVSSLIAGGLVMWLAFGSNLATKHKLMLPTVTDNCPAVLSQNNTEAVNCNMTDPSVFHLRNDTHSFDLDHVYTPKPEKPEDDDSVFFLYRISFMWYVLLGYIIGIPMGLLLTYIPGFKNEEKLDPRLLFPFMRRFYGYLEPTEEKNGVYLYKEGQDDILNKEDTIDKQSTV